MSKFLQIVISIWLPMVVLVGGAWVMTILSGHDYVTKQLHEQADPKDRKGLNERFLGYDTDAVDRHWGVLDERALDSERRFLQLDLADNFDSFKLRLLALDLVYPCLLFGLQVLRAKVFDHDIFFFLNVMLYIFDHLHHGRKIFRIYYQPRH